MNRLTIVLCGVLAFAAPVAAANTKVTRLAPNVYFMEMQTQPEFLGCNSGWVIFEDYVLVIDAGFPLSARMVLAEIKKTTDKPVRYVFDTHWHGDHSFGNAIYTGVGATAGAPTICIKDQRLRGFLAYEEQQRSRDDLTARQVAGAKFKDASIGFDAKMVIDDGKTRVELLHFGHAHTQGDAVAFLPKEKILFTGDACVNGAFNYMGESDSAHWIEVLSAFQELDAKTIGPGHGPFGGPEVLQKQKRYFVELRQQVGAGIAAGKSLDEITKTIDIPFYQQWTGQSVNKQNANIMHVYNEHLGIAPAWYLTRDLGLAEGPSPTKTTPGWKAPKKVLVPNVSPGKLASLKAVAPGVELLVYRTPAEAEQKVGDAEGAIGICTEKLIAAGTKLRWVQAASAGVDTFVGSSELVNRPITLTNAQRIFAPQVADHAVAMLLAFTRGLKAISADHAAGGRWKLPDGFDSKRVVELRGKSVLVVGLGGIGTEVSRRLDAFGVKVYAVDPKVAQRPAFVGHLGKPAELLALAGKVDAVISCVPLTDASTRLFDAKLFAAMKPAAYFIAVGRGPSTDTQALTDALQSGKIAGAGLDVTDPEPLPADHPLWKQRNVLITPHIGSRSDLRESRLFDLYRENLRRFTAGEPLLGVVDKSKGY